MFNKFSTFNSSVTDGSLSPPNPKALSTLATIVAGNGAENGDCRQKRQLQSPKTATVAKNDNYSRRKRRQFGDCSRQCGQGFSPLRALHYRA